MPTSSPPPHFPRWTHWAVHTPALDESIAFYREYCGLRISHERIAGDDKHRVVWMSEPGREADWVLVLIPNGPERARLDKDYSHVGFAVASKADVDRLASRARAEGLLLWEPVQESYPVGYYCGVQAPDGTCVEFSYGQPLGPGAQPMGEETT